MRTTIELPAELLRKAKARADESGITLNDLFVAAIEDKLSALQKKTRRILPVFGGPGAPPIDVLTSEQIDEALFR